MHFIEREVKRLIEKHKTMDPFELCQAEGILCTVMKLHSEVNGIYICKDNVKYIFINSLQSKRKQLPTCYHELGHAVLHEKYNCSFFKTYTFFNCNRFEREADYFAACFLIPEASILQQFKEHTLQQISYELNVPKEYVELRLQYAGLN